MAKRMDVARFILQAVMIVVAFLESTAFVQHQHTELVPAQLGKVDFKTSCSEAVQEEFNQAVAALHSFGYLQAGELFAAIAQKDPTCGMAEWGVAMTHYRQLWDPPTPEDLRAGLAAVGMAQQMGAKTQRERDYIGAVESFYKDSDKLDHRTRALAYQNSMQQLHEHYPSDQEAAIFYALALIANAPPLDKTYAHQKQASAILEKLSVEYPDHPGLAHYIIHCDDHPGLAAHALLVAQHYSLIAPDSPHALHMPSHIFTRMGLWQQSISSNSASIAAARKQGLTGDQLHAMDYLLYAYLQTGRVQDAAKLLTETPHLEKDDAAYYAGLYATASIPARYAIERHRWADAVALTIPPNVFPAGPYAWTASNLYFARALGAARRGDLEAARAALLPLIALRDALLKSKQTYLAEQIDIQCKVVSAWMSLAEQKPQDALLQMRFAADLEDANELPPVTPGSIAPSRELLGDMLLELKLPVRALDAFEAALKVSPQRFNALYGAARSAELAGFREKAAVYYKALLANCPQADADLPEIHEAMRFLDSQ